MYIVLICIFINICVFIYYFISDFTYVCKTYLLCALLEVLLTKEKNESKIETFLYGMPPCNPEKGKKISRLLKRD